MSDKLKINTQILNDEALIELQGAIDEDASFEKIKGLNQKRYVFDFDKLEMINSCGIRDWINFVEGLPEDVEIIYKNCPQIIIEQMNMVYGFVRKGARIESFYAPYYCEDCDEETKIHIMAKDVVGMKAPEVNCPKCGKGPMEFDAIESQYFNFLGEGK